MSELKKIREKQNLTQEELAEKSGISARTIQRIEAGTEPKGYTRKRLAASLAVAEEDLLVSKISTEEIPVDDPIVKADEREISNSALIKIINLSSVPFAWLPIANFLAPLLLMLFTKEQSQIVKQIISLQILMSIVSPIIFLIVAFLKLGSASVLVTMVALTLTNIFLILRNAYEIDRRKNLYYNLNFSII